MELKKLLEGISHEMIQGSSDAQICKIEYDSRKVTLGDLFVCVTGFQVDGHVFASGAVQKGAVVLVCERMPQDIPPQVGIVLVENTRVALAQLSANYYHHPSKEMKVIGVTGTNGKTTITYLMKSILDRWGYKVGVIGTIENRIGDRVIPTERTTPESKELQELLRQMKAEGVSHVVMEVSSHSLDLHRVDGVEFGLGIFTNLTQDHLDYHKTMENYKIAKSLLFQRTEKAVINLDDAAGEYMVAVSPGEVLTYGVNTKADLIAKEIKISALGTDFILDYKNNLYPVHLHTPGRFSVYNALGAIGGALFLGIPLEDILQGLKENQGVTGRFQAVNSRKGCQAVVDYAHTPDGLDNVLRTAREFVRGKLIVVFGCGGDRDKTKRAIMGEVAGNGADFCIITSDNPRTENPQIILDEVEVGVQKTACDYEKIGDRREAIYRAAQLATAGDVIIIAGKGHETYQIFADKTIHFDDMEEIRKAFGEDCL